MGESAKDYFGVFAAPVTYIIRGSYKVEKKTHLITGGKFKPSEEFKLVMDFKSPEFSSYDSSNISRRDYGFYLANESDLAPFIVINPIICYKKKEIPSQAVDHKRIFPEYEDPIKLERPVHPNELPTSMKGTKFFEIHTMERDGEKGWSHLSGGYDLSEWYLRGIDSYNGELHLPISIILHHSLEDLEKILNTLENERRVGDLRDNHTVYGRAVLLMNHKDFGMEQLAQIPEKVGATK